MLIIIGIIGAMLSNFIDDVIQDGMILSCYGKWLNNGNHEFIKKPIGGCMRCTTVWTTILTLLLYNYAYSIFSIIAIIVIANTFLTVLIKLQK